MTLLRLHVLAVCAAATIVAAGGQAPVLRITAPAADVIINARTTIEVSITPSVEVQNVNFFVDGRLLCSIEREPFACSWDPGVVLRAHHIRVVATLPDGKRLIDNLHTMDLGYAERARADAVLVPVVVTHHGEFVRGLKKQDFEVLEDGVAQQIAALVADEAPLELVLAIDISGSMESSLGEVKAAVKQFLSKLRPGDAATLLGFNDTTFVVAEREKDRKAREEAIDLLTSWGGTALYDATIRAVDFVSRETGRKGVVIFSDGEDRHSLTRRDAAMRRVQSSDAMLYTVGFGAGASVSQLRSSLEAYARSTGGRPFFPKQTKELDGIFDEIVAELANQYVLSYSPTNLKQDKKWREISVRVRKGNYEIRARKGYRAGEPFRTGG